MNERILDRWVIDLAGRTATLGAMTVLFSEDSSGGFRAELEGADDLNFRRKLNQVWQASEAFENAWFHSLGKQGG